jgi:predicted aconitase with swiveling domain
MAEVRIQGHKGLGGNASGKALVSTTVICWYTTFDIDGNVIAKDNILFGKNIAGSILVFPAYKGSTVGSITLYEMALKKSAPCGLIIVKADPVTVSGAILGVITIIHGFNEDPLSIIRNDDIINMNGETAAVTILRPGLKL